MPSSVQELLTGRDNNFKLIRFLAATAVIYDHSFTVIHGDEVPWFLLPNIKTGDFGWYAVNIFFILSGFLIVKSWMGRPDVVAFSVSRILRLFPALFVCCLLMAFVMGPVVSTYSVAEYFTSLDTWRYVPGTASLISVSQTLPGVFGSLPAADEINGPLWTLRYEALSYVAVLGLGVLGLFSTRSRALSSMALFLAAYLGITFLTDLRDHNGFLDSLLRFWLCFFVGATFYLLRDKITLDIWMIVAMFLIAAIPYGTAIYEFVIQVALAYGVFWFALVPAGAIRRFNGFGDYSYGLYIFAWPIQQIVVMQSPELTPHDLFLIVLPGALAVAMTSWHFVEQPCLAMRHDLTRWLSGHRAKTVSPTA